MVSRLAFIISTIGLVNVGAYVVPRQATSTQIASNIVPTPGAISPVVGAPPLPAFTYSAANFPPLDLLPDTNSPQVQKWIQDVQSSGVTIPAISPTVLGGCGANSVAAADASRCWWTCTGCTRPTDVTTCPDRNTWGLSYDDGPSQYTPNLLNYLDSVQIKSTFFIVGSRAVSYPQVLQREYLSGHQLSVHTWSHPSLTTLTNEQIIAELGWTREAIRQITGVSPNTFRAPYGDIDDRVRAIGQAMGMTPIIWTRTSITSSFDTNDWQLHSGQPINVVLSTFNGILDQARGLSTGFIVLAHDLYPETVSLAVDRVLPDALARPDPKFTLQPIVTCLHKPLSDAYAETITPIV